MPDDFCKKARKLALWGLKKREANFSPNFSRKTFKKREISGEKRESGRPVIAQEIKFFTNS